MRSAPPVRIRKATLDDAPSLAVLGAASFSDTFAASNSPENMSAYLAASFGPDPQAAEIRTPGACYLVAESEGGPAGFAHLHRHPARRR